MNKNLETLVRDRRLRFAATVMPERNGAEREAEPHPAAGRRPFLNVLRRNLGLVAAVTLAGTVLAGVVALAVPPAYTATAQIIVEPTPAEMAAALLGPVIDTHITTLTSDRRLRAVLGDRARTAAEAARTAKPGPPSLEQRLRDMLTAAASGLKAALRPAEDPPAGEAVKEAGPALEIAPLRDSLLVRQERLSSILAISARSRDPEEAAATVNKLVTLHMEELGARKERETEVLQSELAAQIDATRAELAQAEESLKSYQAANGPNAPDDGAELIADVQRQLATARQELREREMRSSVRAGTEAAPEAGPGASPAGQQQRLDDAYELHALGLRVGRLELRLQDLQAKNSLAFRRRLEQQALELRIASAQRRLDDLMQRRQDSSKEPLRRFAAEARIFSLASVPSRPSSVSPFLLLPPAGIAFCALGIALALLRERMDHTVRSEREVEDGIGIPCLGRVPRLLPRPGLRRPAAARRERERAEAYDSVARALAQICDSGHGMQVVLVTAGRDAGDAAHLAAGLGGGLVRAGYRVLAVKLAEGTQSLTAADGIADPGPARPETRSGALATRDPDQPFDRVAAGVNGAELVLNRAGAAFKILADLYDYVVVDASPALGAIQTRIVAAKADGVVLGMGWGTTRRETACETLQALRCTARLVGEFDVNAVAVLTEVDPRRYARFQPAHA